MARFYYAALHRLLRVTQMLVIIFISRRSKLSLVPGPNLSRASRDFDGPQGQFLASFPGRSASSF